MDNHFAASPAIDSRSVAAVHSQPKHALSVGSIGEAERDLAAFPRGSEIEGVSTGLKRERIEHAGPGVAQHIDASPTLNGLTAFPTP